MANNRHRLLLLAFFTLFGCSNLNEKAPKGAEKITATTEKAQKSSNSISAFKHEKGRFEKQGENWVEFHDDTDVTYTFRETGRDNTWVYAHDDTRNYEIKLPVKDGQMMLRTDTSRDDAWGPYYILTPVIK